MISTFIRLDLTAPLVLSNSAATTGLHQTNRYIQGTRLLGVVASRFDWSDTQTAFRLFRSGQVIFGNGYPLLNDKRYFPAPRALHKSKSASGETQNDWKDLSSQDWNFEEKGQAKQARAEFFAIDKHVAKDGIKTGYTLKSAHNMASGSSKAAQLFGYEYLEDGQSFIAEIKAQTQSDLDQVIKHLTRSGEIRLGRSKASQFGTVKVSILDVVQKETQDILSKEPISLWAISDLYLYDQTGRPNLNPKAEIFGIENASIDWGASYVWQKQFTPYNAALQAREGERIGFGAGSVFRFTANDQNKPIKIPQTLFSHGIGAFREIGAGQFHLMPDQMHRPLTFETQRDQPESQATLDKSQSESVLIDLLQARKRKETTRRKTLSYLETDDVKKLLCDIAGQSKDKKPSASQWRQVLDRAMTISPDDLIAALYTNQTPGRDEPAFCKHPDKGWKEVGNWFKPRLEKAIKDGLDTPLFIRRLIAKLEGTSS